ncbi:MAG: hypothetical protein AAF390_17175, partial [Pseudomonadota bacterium]
MRVLEIVAVAVAAAGAALFVAPYLPTRDMAPAPVVAPAGDLAADERATIDIFQGAQSSVVFITTTTRGMEMFLTM